MVFLKISMLTLALLASNGVFAKCESDKELVSTAKKIVNAIRVSTNSPETTYTLTRDIHHGSMLSVVDLQPADLEDIYRLFINRSTCQLAKLDNLNEQYNWDGSGGE